MAYLILTKGLVSQVDDNLYEWLSKWKWSANNSSGSYVKVVRSIHGGKHHVMLHRQIMEHILGRELLAAEEVDHKDRNPLNNRVSNLRLASPSQQKQNQRKRDGTRFQFKGVRWAGPSRPGGPQRTRPWAAGIKVNGRRKSLGYYESEEEAAMAYNVAAATHFGEFACLNEVRMG